MNKIVVIILIFVVLLLSACSTRGVGSYRNTYIPKPQRDSVEKQSYVHRTMRPYVKKKTYTHLTMRPYEVRGIKYYPTVVSVGDTFKGNASWYGPTFNGKPTSSGEIYDMHAMTAAHKTLPMNTVVKVTNLINGRSAIVRINDRGPFVSTRIIDLSNRAAHAIDMVKTGTAPVKLEVLGFQSKGKKTIPSIKELRKTPQREEIHNYFLQIASFANIKGAIITQEKYDNTNGYKTIIKDTKTTKGRMFKVLLTGFKSEQEARDYKSSSIFKHAFIVIED